jgi:hypothetical protein
MSFKSVLSSKLPDAECIFIRNLGSCEVEWTPFLTACHNDPTTPVSLVCKFPKMRNVISSLSNPKLISIFKAQPQGTFP